MAIAIWIWLSIAASHAQNSDVYMLQRSIEHENEMRRLEKERERVEQTGKEFDKVALCYQRADRHLAKMDKKKRSKLTDAQTDEIIQEIVNECCLEHGCKGI